MAYIVCQPGLLIVREQTARTTIDFHQIPNSNLLRHRRWLPVEVQK